MENTNDKNIVQKIKSECSDIIEIYKKHLFQFLLFRGLSSTNITDPKNLTFFTAEYPKNRLPRDSSPRVQEYLNKIFDSYECAANRSNSIFCTTSRMTARSYTNTSFLPEKFVSVIFPKNGFKFTASSKVFDFYPYVTSNIIFIEFLGEAELLTVFPEDGTFHKRYFDNLLEFLHDKRRSNFIYNRPELWFIEFVLRANYRKKWVLDSETVEGIVDNVYKNRIDEAFITVQDRIYEENFDQAQTYFKRVFIYTLKIMERTSLYLAFYKLKDDVLLKDIPKEFSSVINTARHGDWYRFVEPADVIRYDLFSIKNEKNSKFEDVLFNVNKPEIMITDDKDYYGIIPYFLHNGKEPNQVIADIFGGPHE